MNHKSPTKVGPYEVEVDVYYGHVIVRLFEKNDYGYGNHTRQVASFHSGDLSEAIGVLEGAFQEAHRMERKLERNLAKGNKNG